MRFSTACFAVLAPLGACFSGCVVGPTNGDVIEGDVDTLTVNFSGFATVPGRHFVIEALSPRDQDPNSPTSTWAQIHGPVTASSNPFGYGYDNLYVWSAAISMSDVAGDVWAPGGLMRLRAREVETGSIAITFDDFDCLLEHFGESAQDIVGACQTQDPGVLTLVSDEEIYTPPNNFLQRKSAQNEAEALAYYNAIGVNDGPEPLNFGAWKKRHHLDKKTAGPGEIHDVVAATYYNGSDLGLGRQMHCRHVSACETGEVCEGLNNTCNLLLRSACYVTNFGEPGGDPHDAFADMDPVNSGATVAMEKFYRDPDAQTCAAAIGSGQPTQDDVKFYIFDTGGVPADEDPIQPGVSLDAGNQGAQYVPGLCLNCHGGTAVNDPLQGWTVTGSKFLPFDIDAYEYDAGAGFGKEEQLDAFRQLNEIVLDTELEGSADSSASSTISKLIIDWYGGYNGPHAAVRSDGEYDNESVMPDGWVGHERVYSEVVAPYCRMCHAAFDDSNPALSFADWNSFAGVAIFPTPMSSAVRGNLCFTSQMPHARVTFENFWSSPARMVLSNALGWDRDCWPEQQP